MSCGLNRITGHPLTGWAHVQQSLHVIFSTRFGERIMRRNFGSSVPALLGNNLIPETLLRFYTAIIIAIELFEPRYKVTQISYPPAQNSADLLKQGQLGLRIQGVYRPNALNGDFTVATAQEIRL